MELNLKSIPCLLLTALLFTGCSYSKDIPVPKPTAAENTIPPSPEYSVTPSHGEDAEQTHTPSEKPSEPSGTEEARQAKSAALDGRIICVDAGHGINSKNFQEPIAPGSSEKKDAFASGTKGSVYTEEQLNLIVAKKLCVKLRAMGADVRMTREEAQSDMSNVDRAEFANNASADISVKIHADGNNSSSVSGMSMLIPSAKFVGNEVAQKSRKLGALAEKAVAAKTGCHSRGLIERTDLTGFNWSKVPIILIEMGFMTNPEEDRLLSSDAYQDKIVEGLTEGIVQYFAQ